MGICHGRNKPLGHDDGEDDGKDGDDERALLLAEHNDDDDDGDDVKDDDDERALLLAEHNYLFVRGLPLAALHLVATDPVCKTRAATFSFFIIYFTFYGTRVRSLAMLVSDSLTH